MACAGQFSGLHVFRRARFMSRLFISHASEDKAEFVGPLATRLQGLGHEVWLDKFVLTLGDSLSAEIDTGLAKCDFGIVVLSPRFFAKSWPRAELDALVAREANEREKRILPIWHDVDVGDVTRYSPILASRLGVSTAAGLDAVVTEIERAIQRGKPPTRTVVGAPIVPVWEMSVTAPSLQVGDDGSAGLRIRAKTTFVNKSAHAAVLSFQLRFDLEPGDPHKWVAIPEGKMHENERLRVDAEGFAVRELFFHFTDTAQYGGREYIRSRRARLWITEHITEQQRLVDLPTPI